MKKQRLEKERGSKEPEEHKVVDKKEGREEEEGGHGSNQQNTRSLKNGCQTR